ncbi:uncharacterized protein KIAA1211-like isoform X2 [Microcaecilia unicolor]|uniref:Uncharacterized protein KIAA1211-like isoform X2 n=1 Tax=Microcaecilia unicolor TaxID=1415580 RepID=A0A6P7Y331_9AMPH|nr:uncharacterized protein KIAA1211-like isoform X2 [Microcaecilia unicolor]
MFFSVFQVKSVRIMDTKLREAEGFNEDSSGKKKSKFKSFKKFFGKKKKKETLPSLVRIGLKPSQSASDVTAPQSVHMDFDSEEEMRSPRGILGNRALSHDSIFIPEPVQEPSCPVRVFSQENVSENIRALQLSDSYQHLSSSSLAGTGSEEEEQISSGPSSRPLSPEYQPLHGLTSARAACSETFDDNISPPADFDTPLQFFTCLDNSAAKHRLSIKPRYQRANNMRRLSSRTQSDSLTDLSCTLEEEEDEDKESIPAEFVEKYPIQGQQAKEDRIPPINSMTYSESPSVLQNYCHGLGDEPTRIEISYDDASIAFLEIKNSEQNVFTDTNVVESEDYESILEANLDGETKMGKDLSEELIAPNENMKDFTYSVNSERTLLSNVLSVNILHKKEEITQEEAEAPMELSEVGQVHEESTIGTDLGKQLPKKSSLKHSNPSSHGNETPPDFPQVPLSSKVEMTSWHLGKSKSVAELFVPNMEDSHLMGHLGVFSEKKVEKVANEFTALRKFSVSSAWERPRTGSFTMKGNLDGESLKNPKLSIPKTNVIVPRHEKTKEGVCSNSDHPERKPCIKKQESPAATETRPVDKMVLSASQTPPAMSDSSVVSRCQSDSEDKNAFQVKLRPTSLSLKYRESYCTESKAVQKDSALCKSEQACPALLSKADNHLQIKTASDTNTGSFLNDNGKSKTHSSEHLYEKPPLPRKPVPLNTSNSNTNVSTEKATKSLDSKTESKDLEKRSILFKVAVSSSVSVTESAKGTDSQTKPTWINLAHRKQGGLEDQKLNPEEKHSSLEGDTEKKNKQNEKMEGHVKPQAELIKNKSSHLTSKTTEEFNQETKHNLEQPRHRAYTLPHLISATQSSLLLQKEETVHSSSDQPSWMELAKKKSQAWSNMPRIIK